MHNFNSDNIRIFRNVFSEEHRESINVFLERPLWRYGHVTGSGNTNAPPFWIMQLGRDKLFAETLVQPIREATGDDFKVLSVYANGQTYGLGGQPHEDGYDERARTFLWYANGAWDVRWNGKTCFIFDNGPVWVTPEINKAVYFPGQIKHFAEEPTRTFGGLRKTVAWKLELV